MKHAPLLFFASLLLAACSGSQDIPPVVGLRVYLARHAEKVAEKANPALSPAGRARADALRDLLHDEPLTVVYSTPYKRTRQTAQPTATDHDLPVLSYEPDEPPAPALLAAESGTAALVVGHSNTVPDLIKALGGSQVLPIGHDEYGDLWILQRQDGEISVEKKRFGGF